MGLNQGLSINEQNDTGYTPLYWAIIDAEVQMVKWLLNHGADPNIPNYKGQYPLQYVIENANNKLTKMLLRYGADPDVISDDFKRLFYKDEIVEFIKEPDC